MATTDEERLGAALVDSGVITKEQLAEAQEEAAASGINLVQTLLRSRLITAADIAQAAANLPAEAPPEEPPAAEPVAAPPQQAA
ncbi:MAG: hypothetical protein KKI08_03020, partial [Armatimonadetes bacterium]|nr:hypothetical protein [Armatimonadota bacterium]